MRWATILKSWRASGLEMPTGMIRSHAPPASGCRRSRCCAAGRRSWAWKLPATYLNACASACFPGDWQAGRGRAANVWKMEIPCAGATVIRNPGHSCIAPLAGDAKRSRLSCTCSEAADDRIAMATGNDAAAERRGYSGDNVESAVFVTTTWSARRRHREETTDACRTDERIARASGLSVTEWRPESILLVITANKRFSPVFFCTKRQDSVPRKSGGSTLR